MEGSTQVDPNQHKNKKVTIIIILKLNLKVDWGKARIIDQDDQLRLTWINIRIKIIIFIFLKINSGID
jgi:hypothetical protein